MKTNRTTSVSARVPATTCGTAARWLRVSGLLFGLIAIANTGAADATSPPNIVIVFADDLGFGDLGCFGSADIHTPRLDAMATSGMKFTSFYAQPVCGPSRAALMTGCYPLRVAERGSVKQVHPILHSDEVTVAETLKEKGYATACFGKWDLAKHSQTDFFMDLFPTRQGFDYFYGTPTSNDRVANLYRNEELIERDSNMATLTKRYTDEAIAFIQKNQQRPFFVYIPHTMPHTRLDASPQFKGKSKRGLYGDVIEEIDFNVGRILDVINTMGLADNTYVLFTSDNGPWLIKNKDHADGHLPGDHGGSAGPLRSGKVSTFEGGVRVPTILWGPGRVPAGTTCDAIASTLDVLPTLAALAGAKAPADRVIDGEDIRHLFHGQFAQANPDKAFFYYLRVHLQAVRQGKWKLHLPRDKEPVGAAPFSRNVHIASADRIGFERPFLVNLQDDIGESKDVADQNPLVVERLLQLAEAMRDDLGDYDRVGKNMRFFDTVNPRPTKPPVPAPRKNRANAKKFWDQWALRMPDGNAGWLTLSAPDNNPRGELWTVGGGKQLTEVSLETNTLTFVRHVRVGDPEYDGGPPTGLRVPCRHTVTVDGDVMRLVMHRPLADGKIEKVTFRGKRIPPIPAKPDLSKVKFGEPIELFNGRNLDGWTLTNPKQINGWKAINSELVNTTPKLDFAPYSKYGNLRTTREFMDFNLKSEFKVPPGGNSGIYLRGVYEAQVLDRNSKMQGIQGVGAIFGRIKPSENAGKLGGEWNSYDITLVDRHVTVILNGKKVIDNQPIAGCTNGALQADETIPGPLYLQGDHTAVSYRNIVLRPVLKD